MKIAMELIFKLLIGIKRNEIEYQKINVSRIINIEIRTIGRQLNNKIRMNQKVCTTQKRNKKNYTIF